MSPSPAPVAAFRTATWWVSLWVSTPATTQGPSPGSVPGARPGGVRHHDDAPSSWWARRSGPSRQDVDGALQARIRSCRASTGAGVSPAGRDADRSRPGQTPGAASRTPGHTPPPGRHLHSPRPNLPQRRFAAGSAANESAEYQRFSSGAPARSGSLWQIWTTRAAASPRKGGRRSDGDRGGPPTGRTGTAGRRGRALTGLTRVPLRRGRPAVRTWTRTGGRRP